MADNLTSLANVKEWLNVTSANDDNLLNRLIAAQSRIILSFLDCRDTLFFKINNEIYDGANNTRLFLRQYPALYVTSLMIGSKTVPAAPLPVTQNGNGYILDSWDGKPPGSPQSLTLQCGAFRQGNSSVQVVYASGYTMQNENWTVPALSYQVTAIQPEGSWAVDNGVTYGNGTPLVAVASNPVQGQYTVGSGVYTFNSADAGQGINLTYSYTPFDIEQACIELVSRAYRWRQRIGARTQNIGGQESTSYDPAGMTPDIKMMLQPYKNVCTIL